jgi:hypothetical protein
MKLSSLRIELAAATVLAALLVFSSDFVFAQAPFYEGKTITLVATTGPGGTADFRVKAMIPFLRKHIPGNPTLVIEYMDGGGGRKGANHLYHAVRTDGLTIGAVTGGIVGLGIMREQGVSYDIDKFIYLGTAEHENHAVIYTRRELGLDNLEKLKAKPGIRIGDELRFLHVQEVRKEPPRDIRNMRPKGRKGFLPFGARSEAWAPPTSCRPEHPKTGLRYSKRRCAGPLKIQSSLNTSRNW